MTNFEAQINGEQFIKPTFSCMEFPEFIEADENIYEKIKIDSTSAEIKFKYRPVPGASDRSSISSNTQKRNMILLRIKKSSDKLVKSTECLGLVKNVHVFRDLFDFSTESQSELKLFDEINSASKTYDSSSLDNIVDMLSKNNSEEFEKMDTNSFCIPPFKFSQINLPLSHRDFRSALKVSSRDNAFGQEKSWNVSFSDLAVPNGPSEECVARAKSIPQDLIDVVIKIFDERPIVSKLFLQNTIKDPIIKASLKQILPLIAYHWKNGPWHLLWTRYGCDPRSDPKYRFFQSIELRNKMFAKELRRGKALSVNNPSSPKLSLLEQNIGYSFDGQQLILNYLTYQFLDLTYSPLQEIVNYPGGIRIEVSEKEGWYPEGTTKKLRDLMKLRWFELLKSMDLKNLPQSKIEEILEATAPSSYSGAPISSDWNVFNKVVKSPDTINSNQEYDEDEDDHEEGSDYEIFDY